MIRSASAGIVLTFALVIVGCNQEAPKPRTAIVDLDGVAKAVGRMDQITAQLESATRQLNVALQEAATQIQAEYNTEKEKLGDKPSEEDKQRLAQIAARAQQVLANNKVVAQTRHAQVRAQLIQQFRDEIQPLTEKVAKERGYDVVLVANQNLVWHDPKLDITGAVIDAYKQDPPKPADGSPVSPGAAVGDTTDPAPAPDHDDK